MFVNLREVLFESKKYCLIYLVFILITCLSTISQKNIIHPKFELFIFILVAILGELCILFYFKHKSDKEMYKVAFVIILSFGLICSLVLPISDVSDEREHWNRAEILSQGVIFPHWTGEDMGVDRTYNITNGERSNVGNYGAGYTSIKSAYFLTDNLGLTVFETDDDVNKINFKHTIVDSAFEQNPFYGYLPQAFGILIAKLLDLNVIWMLWLARIFNLIMYAGITSYTIKKTNDFKIPLLAIACIPLAIYQASSVSIDSLIFGLGLLSIGYFINLSTAEEHSINIKNVIVFTCLCLLLGLCKLPYLAFIFLLLFIPKNNFNSKINFPVLLSCVIFVGICGLIYSKYSTPTLLHSWRSSYNLVNSTQQLNFLIDNPNRFIDFFEQIFTTDLLSLTNGVFNFNHARGIHSSDTYYFITTILHAFLIFILFFYPNNTKFSIKSRIGALLVLLIIYIGTCFVQLLSWANVGQMNLGICMRYFIPLFALFPIIFNANLNFLNTKKVKNYSIVLIIGFMATLIIAFATKYY